MNPNNSFAKFLRFIGITLMALTAGFTLMSGIGTVCAALFTETYAAESESMSKLLGYGWLYTIFMLVTIATGVMMVRAFILLIRAAPTSYRDTLISLVTGVVVGVIHIITSRALRGASMPVDMIVYTTAFTLAVFLLFRIPGVWQGVSYTSGKGQNNMAGGAAAIVLGITCLAMPSMVAPSHTWALGVNWANAFNATLVPLGLALVLGGFAWGIYVSLPKAQQTAIHASK